MITGSSRSRLVLSRASESIPGLCARDLDAIHAFWKPTPNPTATNPRDACTRREPRARRSPGRLDANITSAKPDGERQPHGRQCSREERLPWIHDECDAERRAREAATIPSRSPRMPACRASVARIIQTASAIHVSARKNRPPAHQPTSAHAASAGTISSSDCSIGTTTRSSGTSGSRTNARRARRIRLPSLLPRCRGRSRRGVRLLAVLNRSPSSVVALGAAAVRPGGRGCRE